MGGWHLCAQRGQLMLDKQTRMREKQSSWITIVVLGVKVYYVVMIMCSTLGLMSNALPHFHTFACCTARHFRGPMLLETLT